MINSLAEIESIVLKAAAEARAETKGDIKPAFTGNVSWPVACNIGPGLEGAIACETQVGYVNGSQGALIYRGYNVYDLCAYATFEEVIHLLKRGTLPNQAELDTFKSLLTQFREVPHTLRMLLSFPIENMHTMDALRLGSNLMRREFTTIEAHLSSEDRQMIGTDEDSIPMETLPRGDARAVYQFPRLLQAPADAPDSSQAALHLMAGMATVAAAIARINQGKMPLDPDPALGFSANYLYMLTGRRPTPIEERIMDINMILHADHGMNASTFAAIVVASTLSDMYASVGAGVAALMGPLHGGANEEVLKMLDEIGSPENVDAWFTDRMAKKAKIPGFGHRVYKTYDPRARILGPLAKSLAKNNPETRNLYETAVALEERVVGRLGEAKGIYPNVDFFSGLVYRAMGIPASMFTPTFAVSRVAGWTARVLEYLEHNRLFRPRAIYTGALEVPYVPLDAR